MKFNLLLVSAALFSTLSAFAQTGSTYPRQVADCGKGSSSLYAGFTIDAIAQGQYTLTARDHSGMKGEPVKITQAMTGRTFTLVGAYGEPNSQSILTLDTRQAPAPATLVTMTFKKDSSGQQTEIIPESVVTDFFTCTAK